MARLKLKQKNEDGTETILDREGNPLLTGDLERIKEDIASSAAEMDKEYEKVKERTAKARKMFGGDEVDLEAQRKALYATMDELPTCKNCGKTFAEPEEGDTCIVCIEKQAMKETIEAVAAAAPVDDLLAPVEPSVPVAMLEPDTTPPLRGKLDLGSYRGENDSEPLDGAGPKAAPGRPSLDVAIETHRNLAVRVEALCGRILAWADAPVTVRESAYLMMLKCRDLGLVLAEASRVGFVAKTTTKSRIEARIAVSQPVKLREDAKKLWSRYYSHEELEQVEVVGRDEEAGILFVKLGKRENAMPITVKLSQLVAG